MNSATSSSISRSPITFPCWSSKVTKLWCARCLPDFDWRINSFFECAYPPRILGQRLSRSLSNDSIALSGDEFHLVRFCIRTLGLLLDLQPRLPSPESPVALSSALTSCIQLRTLPCGAPVLLVGFSYGSKLKTKRTRKPYSGLMVSLISLGDSCENLFQRGWLHVLPTR